MSRFGNCEAADAFIDELVVERAQLVSRRLFQIGQLRVVIDSAGEIVGLPILMDEPQDLIGMTDRVAWEFGRDDQVDSFAVHLGDVDQAPGHHFGDQPLLRVMLHRQLHQIDGNVGYVAPDRLHQALVQIFRAATGERNLRSEDQDAPRHLRAISA
jgi:hypothetical protein